MASRRVTAFALVLCLVTLLAGCALPWQKAGPQPLPNAQQVFRPLGIGAKNGDLDSLDPALILFNGDYQAAQLIFPPLVTLDDHNQVVPWAADRWETSSDGLTWTFHLHPGMQWSDGTPIDASTYAYSMNRSLDPCTSSGVGYYLSGQSADHELIKGGYAFNNGTCPQGQLVSAQTLVGTSIIAANPLTLQLVLSHPAAYFLASLTYPTAWAQPKQLIERYPLTPCTPYVGGTTVFPCTQPPSTWTDHLADNGGFGGNLFKVKRWDHFGHFDLVRNEAYWGTKPKLKEVDFTLYKDLDTVWADYKAGKGDNFSSPPLAENSIAQQMPGYYAEPDMLVSFLGPNWAIPPFNDIRVRQAFDLALDRATLANLPGNEGKIASIHMVPQGMPGYNPTLTDPEGRTGEAALSPDVAKAGALWKAYVDEKWGGDASKAPIVDYFYRAGSASAKTSADAFVQEWRAAMPGLQVTANYCDRCPQVHSAKIYQLSPAGWSMDYPDPQDFLSLLVHTGAPFNQTSISLPSADALMDQADGNPDPAQRLAQYQQAEQELVSDVAWIPLSQGLNVYIVRPRVAGDYHERTGSIAALAVWQRIFMTGK